MREKKTGKSRGFAFVGFVDQRSTELAVDNLNGSLVCGRPIKVDHVNEFQIPKENTILIEGEEIEKKAYKPSGPDGRGWGNFRNLTTEEVALINQLEM